MTCLESLRGRLTFTLACFLGLALVSNLAVAEDGGSFEAGKLEFFEKKVRPLLAEHCFSCHSTKAKKLQAGLLLDSRPSAIAGGDSGAAIVPGKAESSLLMEAVRYESFEMPPKGKLGEDKIAILERWINEGAAWPKENPPQSNPPPDEFDLEQRKSEHWAWQPMRSPEPPVVSDSTWPRRELDHFILARLEHAGLKPALDVDRAALARRLYFDIIGLPPTIEQLESYLADDSPGATERLVDELLESPHFGERWGRHWLDLVRYAESRGHEFDNDAENAYQYRDYVIRALNADVPYDQFIREQIAGDLLKSPRLHPTEGFNESILGTGFWFLGEWVHSPVDIRKDEADRFDNMIDVMSKTFLGITVSCARCHDHKFDAISTADYYSLSGFLQSSDYRQVRFESLEHNRKLAQKLAAVDAKYRRAVAEHLKQATIELPESPELPSEIASHVVVDFGDLPLNQFIQDGNLFGDEPRERGDAYLAEAGGETVLRFANCGTAISDPFWNGLKAISEKGMHNKSRLSQIPRSGRTLRTPTFLLISGNVVCRVQGTGHVVACVDSHRLIAGPLHGETVREIKREDRGAVLNLNRYVGHRIHLEFTPAPDAELHVSRVLVGASPELLKRLNAHEESIDSAMQGFQKAALAAMPPRLVQDWAKERAELKQGIRYESALAMAMLDGTGEEDRVLIRGNSSKPGPVVPRRFLTAIAGEEPMKIASGSGRLQLAAAINHPENPLTHRVIVNRLWHHLMGRGIVPTTDDFGVLGQRPTHPELLDHLSSRFLQEGRSLKRMIRYIVLSRTYQMSSRFSDDAAKADPKNLLFHHRPLKRLEGEAIRDALLAISGQLDKTQFGEPIPIHLTPFMDGRGKPNHSGPLDGANRRSIYIAVRRNFMSPFMLAFDTPVPFSTMGSRTSSNVPAQALILMNDPFVIGQAKAWAERILKKHSSTEARIDAMYREAFARPPAEEERKAAMEFLGQQPGETQDWHDLAHALINTKEFIFLR